MSIRVPGERLRAALDERGPGAYLITVADDGRPHAVHVTLRWAGEALEATVGKRTAANAAARPTAVSLLYPLRTADDYSLIVDGTAVVAPAAGPDGEPRVLVTPQRAVLHRPASAPVAGDASGCGADCVPLLEPEERAR